MPLALEPIHCRCCWCGQPFQRVTVLGLSAFICQTPTCLDRIRTRVIRQGDRQALYVPLPRQVELNEAVDSGQYRWILYGGAAGGAKSYGLRWLLYQRCLTHPRFRCLLLRRTYPELEKTHMRDAALEAPQFGASALLSHKPPVVVFQNGSLLEFGHCQDDAAVSNYLSAQYDMIAFDELVTFTERMVMLLASRCRSREGSGIIPTIVASTNPGGVGGLWVKDRWIDKALDAERFPYYDPEKYCYVPSLLEDNPYINSDLYNEFLSSLDEARHAAYRYGRWDVFEGQYFDFDVTRHVQDLDIPSDLPRIGGLDWGYAQPGVCLWAVALPDGHLHIDREYVFRKTVLEDVGRAILEETRAHHEQLDVVHADPSMWIRTGQHGESMAETLLRLGVPLVRADHERVNGWQRVRQWLKSDEEGRPWLTISPHCPYLIRTFPMAVHDPIRVEDLDTTGEDHALDTVRFILMGRPAPWTATPKPEMSLGSAGHLFAQARADQSGLMLGRMNVRR